MTNGEILKLVIYLFTFINFIHYLLTRKTRRKQCDKTYTVRKVTPKRQKNIKITRTLNNDLDTGNFKDDYISACWDEIR